MPRIVDHDQRREEILGSCFSLFAREGYAGLTMRDIARQLGVSTGALYHYFDSKEQLFAATLHRLRDQDLRAASALASPQASPAEKAALFRAFLTAHGPSLQDALRLALEFHRQAPGDSDRRLLAEVLVAYREAMSQLLELGQADHAQVVVSLILGQLVQGMLDPDSRSAGPAHDRALQVLLEELLQERGPNSGSVRLRESGSMVSVASSGRS
jgi:AcrR family transcriptional regulator